MYPPAIDKHDACATARARPSHIFFHGSLRGFVVPEASAGDTYGTTASCDLLLYQPFRGRVNHLRAQTNNCY